MIYSFRQADHQNLNERAGNQAYTGLAKNQSSSDIDTRRRSFWAKNEKVNKNHWFVSNSRGKLNQRHEFGKLPKHLSSHFSSPFPLPSSSTHPWNFRSLHIATFHEEDVSHLLGKIESSCHPDNGTTQLNDTSNCLQTPCIYKSYNNRHSQSQMEISASLCLFPGLHSRPLSSVLDSFIRHYHASVQAESKSVYYICHNKLILWLIWHSSRSHPVKGRKSASKLDSHDEIITCSIGRKNH